VSTPEGTQGARGHRPRRLGGPIERFHGAGACDLIDVSALPGNWTHDSYVSAVEQAGDPSLVPVAARSDCGKPMVAVGHGGPPAHALERIPGGLARRGERGGGPTRQLIAPTGSRSLVVLTARLSR